MANKPPRKGIKSVKGYRSLKQDRPDLVKALKKPGRPVSDNPKEVVTLRLDADILEHFKADGAGYQTRINNALRELIDN